MGESELGQLVKSGWPQIMAIVGVIWWSRMIDLRTRDHAERLDKHEARMAGLETTQQAVQVAQARIEERLMTIQTTLAEIKQALAAR